MYSKTKTYLILFGGVFALSTSAIFVRLAAAPSAVTAFYRLFLTSMILMPFFLFRKVCRKEVAELNISQWGQILFAGLFLALHYLLWFESLKYTSIASSTVLVCLQPLFSLAFDRFISKKKITSMALTGCIIALVGSFIIGFGDFRISGSALFGDILALVAAGVIALYFYIGQNARKDISATTYSTMSYLFSSAILCMYILIRKESFIGYTNQSWLAFTGLAVISTIGGQFIFNLLLKKVPASAVTMSILGEPIGTCILAYVIFNEAITLQQLAGMVIIMVGMGIYFFLKKK